MPERRYLHKWWAQVEHALTAVDSSCLVEKMPRATMDRVGHVLLGECAWDLIGDQNFSSWAGFKAVVEDKFGVEEEY